jgi:hypothetical protein
MKKANPFEMDLPLLKNDIANKYFRLEITAI